MDFPNRDMRTPPVGVSFETQGPRTAVIIPIYNQERFLDRCFRALENQTSRDFIAIAVDDGSTDASAGIISDWCAKASFGILAISQGNGGVSAARNRGLDAALARDDTDSVMFLDPDDSYLPACVEVARRAHAAHPGAVVEWPFAVTRAGVRTNDPVGRSNSTVCCRLYPRSAVEAIRFCEASDVAEDLAFNLEVRHRNRPAVVSLDEPLYLYEDNACSTMHRPLAARDFVRRRKIVEHLVSVFADDPAALDAISREEIPMLLKNFWRHLGNVLPEERPAAREEFGRMVRFLRSKRCYHPRRGNLRELKYYLRFLFMA